MHVHGAEVQAISTEVVVVRDRDLLPRELAVLERPDVDVEMAGGARRDVGEPCPVRRERRVHVNLVVRGQWPSLAGRHLDALELDRTAAFVGDVHDPATVGRPRRHRVVLGAVGEFARAARTGIDDPDRAAHRDRDHGAVGRPRRRPRRRARRWREIVVVHVETLFRRRIGGSAVRRAGQGSEPQGHCSNDQVHHEAIACGKPVCHLRSLVTFRTDRHHPVSPKCVRPPTIVRSTFASRILCGSHVVRSVSSTVMSAR